ncbi:MAG: hypothetical protein GKR93_00650 [Gammaproteobacteria bacterium]|nr:hypothetical protein [Gammaproteobacteria bacterium]
MADLPYIVCSGDARERGLAHGQQLKDRIHSSYQFYEQAIFHNSALSTEQIRQRADQVVGLIDEFDNQFTIEIEAIAEAAEIDAWKIYLLNARTEILNAPIAECTSLYFQDSALQGQTWDWIRELEELIVIMHYEFEDGRYIITLTEPGMLAKIGLNNSGLGVSLNFLASDNELDGVPVHILLRALLQCADLEQARKKIAGSGMGKSSHFLVGDANGQCFGMEFAEGKCSELAATNGVLVHTNHCIGRSIESAILSTSAERLSCAQRHLRASDGFDREQMEKILLDDSKGNDSIQASYHAEEALGGLDVGTCATVIMDLPMRRFYAQKGPTNRSRFQLYQ